MNKAMTAPRMRSKLMSSDPFAQAQIGFQQNETGEDAGYDDGFEHGKTRSFGVAVIVRFGI